MDFLKYIDSAKMPDDFKATGITKDDYLDVIELCVKAYDKKAIEDRLPKTGGMVDDIHAYSRIAGGIAALLSNGRIPEYKDLWFSMMDALCNDFHRQAPPNTLDFALKETMLGFKAMKPYVPKEKQVEWLTLLGKVDPETQYSNTETFHKSWDHIRNWNIYAMAGSFLLETEGYTDTAGFFDKYWDHQFKYFDDNGMYMDPHNPILYDLTTRVQAQLIPGYGYKGKFADKLDENLKKGALTALFYQSSAYELPFGGRSNQYLFNESLLTSNFEYEALRWKKKGNLKLAGMYKRAARQAVKSIKRWLEADGGARHIKNFYPTESKYGAESYGYYDKYMMTMGVFLFIGLPFTDDTIPEFPCPAELGGYVFETTGHFHKIFANCGTYSIEIDTAADFFYDATGLGRIHKTGAPTELALSGPAGILRHHRYGTPGCSPKSTSLSPGWDFNGRIEFLSDAGKKENHSFTYIKDEFKTPEDFENFKDSFNNGLDCKLRIIEESADNVAFSVTYSGNALKGIGGLTETYTVCEDGVTVESILHNPHENKICFKTPAFITNGKDESVISATGHEITVSSMGWKYHAETDGTFIETGDILGNRNGKYREYLAKKDADGIKMKFRITKDI
ncbi:MAG: hypothetical protein R3232_02195 [Clostridia bacterium]|nr:hypothetical protein [Clostridia bacterium]